MLIMINLYKYNDFYNILILDKNVFNWWLVAGLTVGTKCRFVYYDTGVQIYYYVQTQIHILIHFFYNKIMVNHNFKLKMFVNS